MELYNFIENNQIRDIETLRTSLEVSPYNLKIKHDTTYENLFLIHNQDTSDTSLKIVRECNGIIIERHLNGLFRIICYTFDKSTENNEINENLNLNNLYCENSIEGTLLKLFYYGDKWNIATKKCIDASKARWVSKKNYYELFMECIINIPTFFDSLNKNHCYAFILTHPENKIFVNYQVPELYHISTRNLEKMVEIEEIIPDIQKTVKYPINYPTENGEIKTSLTYEDFTNLIQKIKNDTNNIFYEGFILIDTNYNRHKVKTNVFLRAKDIWGNTNHRFFRYLELRKDENLLNEYLSYFSYDKEIFVQYELKIHDIAKNILDVYMEEHIIKNKNKIPFYLKKIIYTIHGDFLKDRIKTDLNKIMMYVLHMDVKQICFIMNQIEKSKTQENKTEENNISNEIEMDI
jgi:hypothetical protein